MKAAWFKRYLFHLFAGLPASVLLVACFGMFLDNHPKLVMATIPAIIGGWLTSWKRSWSALFVVGPPLAVFLLAWAELFNAWNPAWTRLSRAQYVWNNLFGPQCAATECLYALTAIGLGVSLSYALGAVAVLLRPPQ